ncbi:hypothetical protein D8674_038222 [Pyrus ussuriensis x Pyrus communis]|uniref:Uncharacterized protein n=1 Tax=Pyrus ussuriensis x Pyrus communis TaxID=2448454 RepID=A0A5N5I0X0_9ROSA|nr:hypothetical protein D8674_038222 [Pyrus ussuriensis x Pyrus communis]
MLHVPSTTVPHAATVRPAAMPGVLESVLVQISTIFNNSKAKTKLQSEERKVTLVVALPKITSSAAVIAYVLHCVKEEAERERQKDLSIEMVREMTEKNVKK